MAGIAGRLREPPGCLVVNLNVRLRRRPGENCDEVDRPALVSTEVPRRRLRRG